MLLVMGLSKSYMAKSNILFVQQLLKIILIEMPFSFQQDIDKFRFFCISLDPSIFIMQA